MINKYIPGEEYKKEHFTVDVSKSSADLLR